MSFTSTAAAAAAAEARREKRDGEVNVSISVLEFSTAFFFPSRQDSRRIAVMANERLDSS